MTRRASADQGSLLDYMKPDGSPALHPPLCACGCSPVMILSPQPAAVLAEQIAEPWEVAQCHREERQPKQGALSAIRHRGLFQGILS